MRIPIDWLKEYVDYKGSAKELADILTMSGTETEVLSESFEIDPNVIVGEILEINPHPNADRLRIPKVQISNSEKPKANSILNIVCGASNIEVGQKVPVALVGVKLGDFEIKEAEIRGVKSLGMICSEQELGISEHSDGIMVLPPDTKIGKKLSEVLKSDNDILEAELTPNRGDCLSMIGIAEEVSTMKGTDVKDPAMDFREIKEKASDVLTVKVENKDLCTRYIARIIKIDQNGPSPKWMQERLNDYGIRPISLLVDVTNYVMVELGQPMHAFDFDKIQDKELLSRGKEVVVRLAKDGETLTTLDGQKRRLTKEDLIITDGKKPIALAGVMGGESSQVDENTKTIILESATFDKTRVRKTAQRLNLRSESSSRFEKGIPEDLNLAAVNRVCNLLQNICGALVLREKIDVYSKKSNAPKIKINTLKVGEFLGEKIGQNEIKSILMSLGFEIRLNAKTGDFDLEAPWWRLDISIKEDVYEEIARIYGYNKIKSTLPKGEIPEDKTNPIIDNISKWKLDFVGKGFTEMYNYSFISSEWIEAMGGDTGKCIKVANPITSDLEYMRTSLIPSLLANVAKNQINFSEIKIFEIAKTYEKAKVLAKETTHLTGAVLSGETSGIKYKDGKEFYIAKGALTSIVSKLGKIELKKSKVDLLHPGRSADIFANNEKIGFVGEVSGVIAKKFGIKKRVAVFDLDLEKVQKIGAKRNDYVPFSRFPSISRDLNFVLENEIKVADIISNVSEIKSEILVNYKIKDIFLSSDLNGKKSVTISFEYQANDRTLSDKEVEIQEKEIIKNMKAKLNGELR